MSISSKDVFALRKQGELGQAFAIAEQLISEKPADEWNQRAYAWCVIDLIKQAAAANDHSAVAGYFAALEKIAIPDDEILQKSLNSLRVMTSPAAPFIQQAKQASEAKDHNKAISAYKQALHVMPGDPSLRNNLGWELYRQAKHLLQLDPINVFAIKRLLHDYMQLQLERPSLLHSSMLRIADGVSKEASFDLPAFITFWGLTSFQPDDFEPFVQAETGNRFSSLAERVLTHAVKQAVQQENRPFLTQALPLLDKVITKSDDPIWLIFHKAKALSLLGEHEAAFKFAADVAKRKMGDYWIWELLGDIKQAHHPDNAAYFYGKALSIKAPEQYLAKLRLKLAKWFLSKDNYAAAKCELACIQANAAETGQNLPADSQQLIQQNWYNDTQAVASNKGFYLKAAEQADNELYSAMPSYFGVVADSFAIKDKPHKKKYRLLIKIPNKTDPVESVVSEQKLKAQKLTTGDAISVKGEKGADGKFLILAISPSPNNSPPDLIKEFSEHCVVSDNGLGFTVNGIFIDPATIKEHNIKNNNTVSGLAIKSFDKKKSRWGWKTLNITDVQVD